MLVRLCNLGDAPPIAQGRKGSNLRRTTADNKGMTSSRNFVKDLVRELLDLLTSGHQCAVNKTATVFFENMKTFR
jgi:hypothetical protein